LKELLVTERLPPVTPEDVVAVKVQAAAVPGIRLLNVATPEASVLTVVVPLRAPQPVAVIAIGAPLTATPLEFLYVTAGAGLKAVPTVPAVGWVLKSKVATASEGLVKVYGPSVEPLQVLVPPPLP
jgi:hypothetical protein